jgi:predicted DNA-binding protein
MYKVMDFEAKRNKTITCRLTDEMYEELELVAKSKGKTISSYLFTIIKQDLCLKDIGNYQWDYGRKKEDKA